ncbi:MAG: 1-deoxy-D-xylulose-5-phosphate reductoisomerase [Candidatus Marinimicrobia bacterium]|nr:1-deoxy-D-xylulose-5-phosphate reductoisomerase [Candidatus Neomarinimicrobiota bacterium]
MKRLTLLGSTGSIGTQALEVVAGLPEQFELLGLTARSNAALLAEQAQTFGARAVAIENEARFEDLKTLLAATEIEVLGGRSGLLEIASRSDADLCLNGVVSGDGMALTMAALEAGVDVALANKESMVMAGEHIRQLMERHGASLFPVDSEHSAIWQCLVGERMDQVRRLVLTGSGGPFRTTPIEKLKDVTKAEALNHPNWDMGPKITIDSATMMNKGLEVIEARWLFDTGADKVDIIIHPQSIIHSMVEFVDGSVKAQLGVPDMKVPLQYALTYPDHVPTEWPRLDLVETGQLTFEAPDLEKFPCISLAYTALDKGGSAPAALNLANDITVQAFLDDRIRFIDISRLLETALENHPWLPAPDLDDLGQLGEWTDQFLDERIGAI